MVCSCILVMCKMSGCQDFGFRLFWKGFSGPRLLACDISLGSWPGGKEECGANMMFALSLTRRSFPLQLAFCGVFTSYPGSLHLAFIKWVVSWYLKNVCIFGKPFAIVMVYIYICASLKIIPQLILKGRVTDMETEKLISLVSGLKWGSLQGSSETAGGSSRSKTEMTPLALLQNCRGRGTGF